jgi:hypothetical protein
MEFHRWAHRNRVTIWEFIRDNRIVVLIILAGVDGKHLPSGTASRANARNITAPS